MATQGGHEYFWMAERVMADYRIDQNERADVLAHAVYLTFVMPYPLSFNLVRWSVLRAIRIHCGIKKYTLVPFHQLDNSWIVFQPEIQEDKIINFEKYRQRKNSAVKSISLQK